MDRQPPRSPLFPYTTLADLAAGEGHQGSQASRDWLGTETRGPGTIVIGDVVAIAESARSEEHTSELQSHSELVCRLLLEKKNGRKLHPKPRKLSQSPR